MKRMPNKTTNIDGSSADRCGSIKLNQGIAARMFFVVLTYCYSCWKVWIAIMGIMLLFIEAHEHGRLLGTFNGEKMKGMWEET
uniref:Uncharacterized protein n=1 Tax=Tanacetum cinerariifolium TaxID=118510 RepID=A0A6L2L9V7_TANCI|nr:hypothetical protein [Tanacetum cinerariifolium]